MTRDPIGQPEPGERWSQSTVCGSCKKDGVWYREDVDAVHGTSGDAYGHIRERCPRCGHQRSYPFSDN